MRVPGGVRPLQGDGGADLLQHPQRPHGKFVQGDFTRLLRQPASGGDGQHRMGIVPVRDRQLHRPLPQHGVGQGAHGTQPHRAFDIGMLGEQRRLMLSEAGV